MGFSASTARPGLAGADTERRDHRPGERATPMQHRCCRGDGSSAQGSISPGLMRESRSDFVDLTDELRTVPAAPGTRRTPGKTQWTLNGRSMRRSPRSRRPPAGDSMETQCGLNRSGHVARQRGTGAPHPDDRQLRAARPAGVSGAVSGPLGRAAAAAGAPPGARPAAPARLRGDPHPDRAAGVTAGFSTERQCPVPRGATLRACEAPRLRIFALASTIGYTWATWEEEDGNGGSAIPAG
jgi:hypothetical protein